ncbi:insulinase family protein [Tessaracoccus rhinocerotis]|uniref:Insulinase family protein n=1 Tax=Tessaracoccus rhinocerotis TaxID=1689449 RepID=A0A553K1R9_9ACTN|nr:insulinase family protein [Tessaracoccus rhinocerotis]TRY18625.1 insulinase family protein [Tessaracoccus rhinocerotis]
MKVLLRRWLVILIGLLLTGGAVGYLMVSTPPSYVVSSRLLLLLPNDARGPDAIGSPFLYLPSGLQVLAGLIAGTPATLAFQTAKAEEGLGSSVEVAADRDAPMLTVQVSGTDPRDVLDTRDWVLSLLQTELRRLQEEEGAPNSQIAHARVFASENVPTSEGNPWLRPALVVVAAGGVVTLLAAFAVDSLVRRRAGIRAARRTDAASDPSEEGTPNEVEPTHRAESDSPDS